MKKLILILIALIAISTTSCYKYGDLTITTPTGSSRLFKPVDTTKIKFEQPLKIDTTGLGSLHP